MLHGVVKKILNIQKISINLKQHLYHMKKNSQLI